MLRDPIAGKHHRVALNHLNGPAVQVGQLHALHALLAEDAADPRLSCQRHTRPQVHQKPLHGQVGQINLVVLKLGDHARDGHARMLQRHDC
jgi:hypothetical protein